MPDFMRQRKTMPRLGMRRIDTYQDIRAFPVKRSRKLVFKGLIRLARASATIFLIQVELPQPRDSLADVDLK